MPILITGGCGFIGTALAQELISRDREVALLDLHMRSDLPQDFQAKARMISGNLADFAELLSAFKAWRPHTIYHAGAMLTAPSEDNPQGSFETNILGTYHLLEAARLFEVDQVIFLSSIGTYAASCGPITDKTIQRPQIFYGIGKVFGELWGQGYARKYNLDFRGLRLPSIIGPGVRTRGVAAYNAWMIEKSIRREFYEVFVEEATRIPILYVKDAVRALIQLAEADRSVIKTRVYNIAGMRPVQTAGQLAGELRRLFPPTQITFKPDPSMMDIVQRLPDYEIDDSTARQEWNWQPKYSFLDTVMDFAEELRPRG